MTSLIFFTERDMALGLFIMLLFTALTGPMIFLTIVVAGIIAVCNALSFASHANFVAPIFVASLVPAAVVGTSVGIEVVTTLHVGNPLLLILK
jgi:hypothetical protein